MLYLFVFGTGMGSALRPTGGLDLRVFLYPGVMAMAGPADVAWIMSIATSRMGAVTTSIGTATAISSARFAVIVQIRRRKRNKSGTSCRYSGTLERLHMSETG